MVKMFCKIPENIDRILFEELGAKYQLGDNFDLNLQNDDLRNKNYLGNYFFRSYSESYQLFTAFFKNRSIQKSFGNKSAVVLYKSEWVAHAGFIFAKSNFPVKM